MPLANGFQQADTLPTFYDFRNDFVVLFIQLCIKWMRVKGTDCGTSRADMTAGCATRANATIICHPLPSVTGTPCCNVIVDCKSNVARSYCTADI